MARYVKKQVEIDAYTFDEVVEYGIQQGGNIVNNMPWSFEISGHAISHENDKCYLIATAKGAVRFTPDDLLIVGEKGNVHSCNEDLFHELYESV